MSTILMIWILSNIYVCFGFLNNQKKFVNSEPADNCFCQLSGRVDDCCCTIEDVVRLNNKVYPKLKYLVGKNYFRYIKLRLHRDCTFWPDFHQCALKDCSVDVCTEEELPPGLKKKENVGSNYIDSDSQTKPCSVSNEMLLSDVDTTISDQQAKSFQDWSKHDFDSSFCVDLEEDADDADWIDLFLNPEQYTGYQGDSPHRIWNSIYKENCFLPREKKGSYEEFQSKFLSKTCLEKRVFYRLMSGLHASINLHLSYKHLLTDPKLPFKPVWGPNLKVFQERFGSSFTNGKGPYWLRNVYFTYLLTLRAVMKAWPYWEAEDFYTGNTKDDQDVKNVVRDLIKTTQTCPSTFDESSMFTGDMADQLKEEFRLHYKNITRIMDCVGCEKCRLWGKLQTFGIGTALKILFSFKSWENKPMLDQSKFALSRTEIVSLFNALNKLSESIHIIKEFQRMDKQNGRKEL